MVLAQRYVGQLNCAEACKYFIRKNYTEEQKRENQELS